MGGRAIWLPGTRPAALLLVLALLLRCAMSPAQGMIFYGTDDPVHNTTPPTGEFADSGWQWQGHWLGFTGTAVGSYWFLTARHVGGGIGNEFQLGGESYRATAYFDDPATDLRLWRVCEALPSFAPLRTAADETGEVCVLFGRGLSRGAEVTLTNAGQTELRGWYWGAGRSSLRWGVNRIAGYANLDTQTDGLLTATFDADGEPDEATLAVGDSGGGVFIERDGHWELAGIAYAVDGPFSYVPEDPGFSAALFDQRGLYEGNGAGWSLIEPGPEPLPAALYATRVSIRREWIESIMAANPESLPQLVSAGSAAGPFEPVPAEVDVANRELRTPRPADSAYYQLSACQSLRIVSVRAEGNALVIRYE